MQQEFYKKHLQGEVCALTTTAQHVCPNELSFYQADLTQVHVLVQVASASARAAGILKRQKKAGVALVGRAAQLKCRAVLVKRHGHIADDGFVDELSTAVGKPGQIYMVGAQGTSSMCKELPPEMEVSVSEGESHAQAMLLDYHTQACSHAPGTKEGRDAALQREWAGPQQALALQGRNTGSLCMCNAVVCMRQAGELVGLLAMHVDSGVRKCVVQAIHVAPKVRGPWMVPNHLWEHARSYVAGLA